MTAEHGLTSSHEQNCLLRLSHKLEVVNLKNLLNSQPAQDGLKNIFSSAQLAINYQGFEVFIRKVCTSSFEHYIFLHFRP